MGFLKGILMNTKAGREEAANDRKIKQGMMRLEMDRSKVGAKKHEAHRKEMVDASVAVLEQILADGVQESEARQLEYFFYAENSEAAEKMQQWVTDGKYDTKPIEQKDGRFLVNGFSTPKKMDVASVKNWVHNMCNAGLKNDCKFEAWGLGK